MATAAACSEGPEPRLATEELVCAAEAATEAAAAQAQAQAQQQQAGAAEQNKKKKKKHNSKVHRGDPGPRMNKH